jgi:hypothetical protein
MNIAAGIAETNLKSLLEAPNRKLVVRFARLKMLQRNSRHSVLYRETRRWSHRAQNHVADARVTIVVDAIIDKINPLTMGGG